MTLSGRSIRLHTGPISGDTRLAILSAGYIELRSSPDPDASELRAAPRRVLDVGPDWIDVEDTDAPR